MSNRPSSQAAIDMTVQAELKKIKDVKDQFPAVNLLAALIRLSSVNATVAPRNVHTAAQIVTRSNKVYEAIIQTMLKLESTSIDALDNNWDLFDKYTTAIPVLEQILLGLPHATVSFDKTRSHLPPDDSTQEAVFHIHGWLAERKQLNQALESLKDESLKNLSDDAAKALVADHILHRITDDKSTLKALLDVISKDKLVDRDIIREGISDRTVLADVKKLATDIYTALAQKPPSEEVSGIVVRALMTAYIPLAVNAKPTTSLEWRTYLKGGKLWFAIKELLTKVKAHISSPGKFEEGEFSAIEALLLKLGEISISTTKEMLDLIKLAAYIPRPYSGRTASLVKTIYHVDQFSRKEKNKALTGYRHNLKETMETSLQELTVVRQAPYDFQKFSLDSEDYKSRKESIKKLFSGIESLFASFGISTDWSGHDAAFTTSVKTDEEHMKDGQKALIKASQ
ncbi:hypothetical protein HYPSUDRAFT_201288 [Hypholoma sublateritium FD-334 SS-4]|uniref:Uncharacterized protein n=1 Tax=Hypholoma sublateritium (strain FD-334 SS-4) TaxID=945553 RepID=A0A0D2L8M2_HYPSF|nr:hypothetical protein HYPSUDRAFT_201288 [Hypholoma sublateritium FD-334 SS-4]